MLQSDLEDKIRQSIIDKVAEVRAGRMLAGSMLAGAMSKMEINPETAEDRAKRDAKMKASEMIAAGKKRRAGVMLAGGILDTPADGGVMLAGKKKRGGTLLIDDISATPIIGGKKYVKKSTGASRGDGGSALAAYRAKLDAYRAKHPNVPYREAQRIVAGK